MSIEAVPRKSGRVWRVRWRDADGRERSRVTGRRRKDAELFEEELLRRRRLGQLADWEAGRQTLGEFVETWWNSYAVINLAESTQRGYAKLWDRHIEDRLSQLRLCDLRPSTIDDFRAELTRAGVGDAQVRQAMMLLQGVLQRAVERELIPRNPASAVKKPRQRRKREPHVFTPEQTEAMRQALAGSDDLAGATLISVLAYAGLRPGEALALRWSDLGVRTVRVNKAVALGKVKETKTGQSRTVQLWTPLRTDLGLYRASTGAQDSELVFPGPKGGPWDPSRWRNWGRRVFREQAAAIGVTGTRPYDLRHTFVSLLIAEGCNVVEVAAQAGHGPALCLSTYAHLFAEGRTEEGSVEDRIWAARRRAETEVRS